MKVFEMKKEDFENVPERGGFQRDIGEFHALVIIPQDYAHDSGWMCMDFVAVGKEGEPICKLSGCSDVLNIALVLTTGGTGFSPRDITPEAAMDIIERPTPGIPEAMRAESMRITPKGCLSRSVAGIRGRTLIITLPGSKKASAENILAVIGPVAHGLDMLYSEGSADCAK